MDAQYIYVIKHFWVDVVRVKSYVNNLLNPMGVLMWVAVNKLNRLRQLIEL